VLWGNPDLGMPPFDPAAWARRYRVPARQAAAAFVDLLLQGDIDPRARELVLRAGAAGTADGLRKALQRVLACPEFQLA
jgi:hypothetical protein